MRYEETKHVGDDYTIKDYEGTPEEIAKLIEYQNKPKRVSELAANIIVSPDIVEKVKAEIDKGFEKIEKENRENTKTRRFRKG